jgi:hypothetical protein
VAKDVLLQRNALDVFNSSWIHFTFESSIGVRSPMQR